VILDTYFLQRRAEMFQECIEVKVVQLWAQVGVDGAEILARTRFWSAE
jgi:hypothetical protein